MLVVGARQVGKSTLVTETVIGRKTRLLNFDIPSDLASFKAAAVLPPAEVMRFLGNPEVLIIDEAQRLPEVSRIVKGWFDAKLPVRFVLLGSSSLNLLAQSAESLTGRNLKLTLPPLLFSEILHAESWFGPGLTDELAEQTFAPQLRQTLLRAMTFGCYPEIAATRGDPVPLLRELAGDYLYKDVLQAGLVKTPDLIRRLLTLLAHQVGSEVSTSELAVQLGMSRITVERYLDLLEETFVIFRLPSFSRNPRKEICKGKKIFFWDTGIRNTLVNALDPSEVRPDIGALFENFVVAEVKKRATLLGYSGTLAFWRTKMTQHEVDLVLADGTDVQPFEIKWNDAVTGSSIPFKNAYGKDVITLHPSTPSRWPLPAFDSALT